MALPITNNLKKIQHSTNSNTSVQVHSYKEIRIPGLWGNIAGKWWGPYDKRPILAIHGWQDNCGSFDRLVQYLSPHLGFLAIDLPGHGLSDRLPPGMFYYGIEIVFLIQSICKYFKWSKVSILGHSIGAMYGYAYTMLFPKSVDFIICLDSLYPTMPKQYRTMKSMAESIDRFLKYDYLARNTDQEPLSYTYEKLEEMVHNCTYGSIARDTCKYVLKRNITQSKINPGKFCFLQDPRTKAVTLMQWPWEVITEGSKRITCPIFVSVGSESPVIANEKSYLKLFEIIKKHNGNNNFEYHLIEGTHHAHLNNPKNVANLINAFIKKYDEDDRSVGGLPKNQSKL